MPQLANRYLPNTICQIAKILISVKTSLQQQPPSHLPKLSFAKKQNLPTNPTRNHNPQTRTIYCRKIIITRILKRRRNCPQLDNCHSPLLFCSPSLVRIKDSASPFNNNLFKTALHRRFKRWSFLYFIKILEPINQFYHSL